MYFGSKKFLKYHEDNNIFQCHHGKNRSSESSFRVKARINMC